MTAQQGFFILFGIITVTSALRVALSRNLFHAALWLVMTLGGVAALFVLLEAGFLAATQVLLYIGAIAILIIFAVMLTRGVGATQLNSWSSIGAVTAVVLLVILAQVIGTFPWPQDVALAEAPADYIQTLGASFVDPNQFVLPFELVSVMLLLALIGSIFVARARAGQH